MGVYRVVIITVLSQSVSKNVSKATNKQQSQCAMVNTNSKIFSNDLKGGAVAERVERWTCDQQVVGSNPTRGKPWASCSHLCACVTKQYNLVPAKGVMLCGGAGNRKPGGK